MPFFVCDANVSMSGWGTALPVYLLAERPGGPWVLLGGSLLTVGADADGVEASLRAGRLACPSCAGSLSPWGFARARSVRTADGLVRLRPRRCMCVGCGRSHVLLPLVSLLRRADGAAVIGAALAGRVAGLGHRRIAAGLAVAPSTVRGWLRRFTELAGVRWPFVLTVSAWEFAGAVTNGRLLAPSGPAMLTNTTRPWAGHR